MLFRSPICWSTAVGAYSDIITSVPFSETPSRWEVRNNGNGIVGSHFVVNVYSGYNNQTYSPINTEEWLMSPVVSIDSTTMLSFTLARTAKNGAGTPSMTGWWNQYDDRFYVIISTDGGISWDADNAVVWGNNNPYMGGGNFNYSFTAISTTGTNYTIDLSRYAGNDVIVGFYAESTQEDYDLDLHVGNIMMVNLPKLNVSASICQGNSYSGNGFNIPASSNEEVGKYSYTRTTAAADTVVILSLEVLPNSVTSFQATICQGDVYAANGFNETMSGLYHQYLTSAIGCDSIVELYLMVMSDTTFLEERTICASELPYSWNGQTLTAAGTHTAGVPSSLGCDSTVLLTLTVLAETHTTDYLELAFEELPYTYNDTIFGVDTKLGASAHVFHYTDANGCDSTHTLTLVVKEPVGTVEVENADMSLYPNPVKRDGQVMVDGDFTEAEIDGMVVDVYNSQIGRASCRERVYVLV